MRDFLKEVTEYFGIDPEDKQLYDINSDLIEGSEQTPISIIIKLNQSKEYLYPDVFGGKKAVIYIGDKIKTDENISKFKRTFDEFVSQKRKIIEDMKEEERMQEAMKQHNDGEESSDDFENSKFKYHDEIKAMKHVPGLVERYIVNYRLKKKMGHKGTMMSVYRLFMYGEWQTPTCCSILISFIQFILTINMIYIINGKPQVYWQPQTVAEHMKKPFKLIQNQNDFWQFMRNEFTNELFNDQIMWKDGNIDIEVLKGGTTENSGDEEINDGKHRVQIGKLRMTQYRVKPKECSRGKDASKKVPRYKKYYQKCYNWYFNDQTMQTSHIVSDQNSNNSSQILQDKIDQNQDFTEVDSWQKFARINLPFRLLHVTAANELYSGEFGKYPPL